MKGHIIENKFQDKPLFLVVDLNTNSLDYSRNTHVCDLISFFEMVYFLRLTDQPE